MPRSRDSDAQAERSRGLTTPVVRDSGLVSATIAMATVALLVAVPYVVSGLDRFQVLTPLPEGESLLAVRAKAEAAKVGETKLEVPTDDEPTLAQPETPHSAASADSNEDAGDASVAIVDPSGHALDAFFAKLAAAERKEPGAIARISYFGDSIVASDWITATLRRDLQRRFGDAGHGFMLLANAWPGYFHNDVSRFASAGWLVSRVVGPFAEDGFYGLGGVSFRTEGPGVFARFATAKSGTFGRAVSRFTLSYLEQPGGGAIAIAIDGEPVETIDTSAETARAAFRTFEVEDGPHRLEVRALGINVRAFGVVMERSGPGVVLDAIGIQGCRMRMLAKSDEAHFAAQLRARDPSLTVFQYGMNESEDGEIYPLADYERTMREVLAEVQRALPNASCMLVGPMDRADNVGGVYRSRPVIAKLAAIQRKVSGEVGCAYWDTLEAMGGLGSMGTWIARGLGGIDLAHPSSTGAARLGGFIDSALMRGFEAYKAREAADARPEGGE